MASGMDTDFIIQQTMRMHQFRIDQRIRQKTLLEWRQDTHNSIKTQIDAFRNDFLSMLGSKSMVSSNAYNTNRAAVSGASGVNTGAVTIRTSANSTLGNMRINSINQLARGARAEGSNVTGTGGAGLNPTSTLGSLRNADGTRMIEFSADTLKLNIGTAEAPDEITVYRDTNGTAPVFYTFDKDEIRHDIGSTDVEVEYDDGKFVTLRREGNSVARVEDVPVYEKDADGEYLLDGSGNKIQATDGDGNPITEEKTTDFRVAELGKARITINSEDIDLEQNMSINAMINAVNNHEKLNVTMSYDRLADRFMIETNETRLANGTVVSREGETLTISGQAFEALKLIEEGSASGVTFANAQNALLYINGEMVTSNTNTFDFRGVNITLNETFNTYTGPANPGTLLARDDFSGTDDEYDVYVANHTAALAAYNTAHDAYISSLTGQTSESINVSVTRNIDETVDRIKGFIEAYNSIIERLEGLLSERKTNREKSYMPLTDEEKSDMTEKQIEQWEEIARKGILRNDIGLQRLTTDLRRALFETVESAGLTAADIGLTTGTYRSGTGGQIVLNEEKLREALERDPDRVASVFSNTTDGLTQRMDRIMNDFVGTRGSQRNTLDSLERSLERANEQIDRMQQRMWAEEEALYRRFAAMETAMSRLTSQGEWFASMLGSLQ